MEIEGSGGGGLTPWALISGLGTDRELGASAYCTYLKPEYFSLTSCGLAAGAYDRIELSYARLRFGLDDVAPGQSIDENVFGAKVRLFGDAVFDQDRWWPQVAVGVQYKQNEDFDFIPRLIGARHDEGTDYYLAATKVYLAGPFLAAPGSSMRPSARRAPINSVSSDLAATDPTATGWRPREARPFSYPIACRRSRVPRETQQTPVLFARITLATASSHSSRLSTYRSRPLTSILGTSQPTPTSKPGISPSRQPSNRY